MRSKRAWSLLEREYATDIGPVDLLCRDADGQVVAVEIKRRGEIDGVEQLTRYLDFLNRDPRPGSGAGNPGRPGDQAPGADAGRRPGIGCVDIDYDALRGIESNVLKLF